MASVTTVLRLAAVGASFLLSLYILHLGPALSLLLTLLTYLCTGGWRFAIMIVRTGPRDVRSLAKLSYVKLMLWRYLRTGTLVPDIFMDVASRRPGKLAMVGEDDSWTFARLDAYSNTVANLLLRSGYRQGDVVAVFAESQPAYVGLWLGMAKAGVVPALINFNLRAEQLLHCVRAAQARALVFDTRLANAVAELEPRVRDLALFCLDGTAADVPRAEDLNRLLSQTPTHRPTHSTAEPKPTIRSPLFYIYTSGTTGMPKAAIVTHARYVFMAKNIGLFFNISDEDTLFTALPLYHTAGGILGTGQVVLTGATMVVRRKFSASRFWKDCVQHKCTVVQYIGELCRYLLAQPSRPEEKMHRVRLAFGNGLRPQIWTEFQRRFQVAQIGEFYGATESNANLINPDNTVGAVGFITQLAPILYPVRLIRVDEESNQPIRDPRTGLCVCCQPGEPGELVGKIIRGDLIREFDGYVNREATNRKIVHDVFSKGDSAFLTGDILEMDHLGYVYFRDRTGDTYRWRGENVSTSEVESIISNILHLADCVVYGVRVPGTEGRAGMAAIARENGLSEQELINRLVAQMPRHLAPYARPVFLRFVHSIESTGTFKMKKTDLVQWGFDPQQSRGDNLLYFDMRTGDYRPVTADVYNAICSQTLRL